MAVIDDKVVAMSFESSKFESGVSSTISALDKLKASLKLPASSKGLEDVGRAAQKVDLSRIGQSLDAITQKLGYFSVAAIAIFTNVAMKAVQAGAQMIKGLTLQPILAGYQEYSTNLNSIQTILANTEASGATLDDVNKALNQLNVYSDKTIYNFSQMARNIGTFTAAGVDLQTSTNAIKGIANLAALSGSSADQASTAMYQLSQAIAAGSVKLQDWNSVVNAGMGGTVFQRALAQTAEAMGTLEKGTVKLTGPMKNVTIAGQAFRQSLSTPGKASWLTSKVLTQTLKQFTGDLKNADLAAMGFNKSQIKAIQQTAKTAMFAATEVKTLTQVLDVAKETAGSGWAKTWQLIFGDFGEAKRTFTDLSNAVNGFINANAKARNSVLTAWKDMGGRTLLIDAIKTAFTNLGLILKPIRKAFRDIFPAKTGQDLFNFTNRISDFAYALAPTAKTMNNLRRTFRGLFAVLDIGKQIVSGIFGVFGKLFDTLNTGSGSFLKFTAKIGDFLVNLDQSLKKGDKLSKFFDGLGTVLAAPIKLLQQLAKLIGEVFDTGATKGFTTEVKGMSSVMDVFSAILDRVAAAFGKFINQVRGAPQILKPFIQAYTNLISGIGDAIGTAASNMNFDAIFQVIRTGLFAGLVLMFKNFFGKGSFMEQISRMGRGLSGGILGNISGAFQGLNGSMQAMQQNIKAKTLKEIAIAIALLVASVVALSFVNPERVNAGISSIALLMGELLGAMSILTKISKTGGIISIPVMAGSLILLAGAIDILVLAVLGLSRLSWNDLLKGLGGVAVLLLGVTKAATSLSTLESGIVRSSFAIGLLAASLVVLAVAVKIMGSMDLADLAKGLGGVVVALVAVSEAATRLSTLESGIVRASFAIGLLAGALVILSLSIRILGSMRLADLAKGLYGMAAGLAAMVIAMNLMPEKSMLRNAAALLVMATAMGIMAGAIKLMGGMSPKELAIGLTALGGALLILTVAMQNMTRSLRGAATLGVVAAAMAILAPALVLMGKQSWGQIVKGLTTLAGALVIMGTAGKLLAPAVPALLGFGIAMLAIGAGLALAGAGVLAIGLGLSAIAVAGPAAVGIMVAAMRELLEGIIKNSKLLVLGLLEIVNALADSAPKFTAALVKIIGNLLNVVIQSAPKFAQAFIAIIDAALKVIAERKDAIIAAGFALLISLLEGIKQNIGQVTQQVIDVVVIFLQTLASNLGRIVASGVQVLVKFLEGIAKGLPKVITAAVDIIVKFLEGISKNLTRIVTSGANVVVKWIEGVAKNLPKIVDAGIKFIISFINALSKAIDNNSEKMGAAGARLGIAIIKGMIKGIWGMAGELLSQLTRLAGQALEALKSPFSRIYGLGRNIISGLISGLSDYAQGLYNKAKEIADKVWGFLKAPWNALSPSRTMMELGKNIILGMSNGLIATAPEVYDSAKTVSNTLIKTFKDTFGIKSPSTVMEEIGKFVGQGFTKGLKGSQDDMRAVFKELNDMLVQAMSDARETIISEEAKLDELRKAKKPDADAIKKAQDIIAQNESILKRSIAAHQTLTGALNAAKTSLTGLAKEYEKLGVQLSAAQDKLAQLKQEKADFIASTTDQFGALPDIPTTDADGNPIDQLTAYMDALANQTEAVATYKQTLEQLRKLGLDDATYEKLLAEGTADQAFATQLLAGGKTAVESLNTLDADLEKVSKTLAVNAAKNLKQAGIDAAQGLVDGLKAKRGAIAAQMREIAKMMIKALRDELDSNSPSKEFEKIGKDSMLGLAYGFTRSSKMVTNAIVSAADDALSSMKSSLSKISDVVMDQMDVNPTITPILDLSYIRDQASELADLTNVSPITAAASYNQATAISAEEIAAMAESVNAANAPTVTFEQNNYSPKALSEIEIYRQTKNQISQVKSALAIT